MRIAIAADHNGLAIKARLIERLTAAGHERGRPRRARRADRRLPAAVRGRLPAGHRGPGRARDRGRRQRRRRAVACNKIRGIRAGLCHDPFTTGISRSNNDSNVLVLGAKVLAGEQADELVDLWLRTAFRGGVHQRRIERSRRWSAASHCSERNPITRAGAVPAVCSATGTSQYSAARQALLQVAGGRRRVRGVLPGHDQRRRVQRHEVLRLGPADRVPVEQQPAPSPSPSARTPPGRPRRTPPRTPRRCGSR